MWECTAEVIHNCAAVVQASGSHLHISTAVFIVGDTHISGCFSGLTPHWLRCSVFPAPLYTVDGSRVQLLNGDKTCDLRCFHPSFHCSQVQRVVERTSQNSFTQRCCPAMWFQWLNQGPAATEPQVYHPILPSETLISSLEPVMI